MIAQKHVVDENNFLSGDGCMGICKASFEGVDCKHERSSGSGIGHHNPQPFFGNSKLFTQCLGK
jgi:hypothetical protein